MEFVRTKERILGQVSQGYDKSVKQSIDTLALPIVEYLNNLPQFVTTSSCSGRISIISSTLTKKSIDISDGNSIISSNSNAGVKKGGKWLFVSHEPVVDISIDSIKGNILGLNGEDIECKVLDVSRPIVYFKFEPFILHTEAESLEHAQKLLSAGLQAGYRNSGLVISPSSSGRFMVAFRHTMKLDVPIGYLDSDSNDNDKLILSVSLEYIQSLLALSNEKFKRNSDRMEILLTTLKSTFTQSLQHPIETKEERRQRKRAQGLHIQQSLIVESR